MQHESCRVLCSSSSLKGMFYLIHRKLFSIITCSQYDSCFFAFNQAGRNKRDGKLFLNVSNVFLQTYCNVKHQMLDNNGQYRITDVFFSYFLNISCSSKEFLRALLYNKYEIISQTEKIIFFFDAPEKIC